MGNERKEQGTTRQHILQLLRRSGQMTALELAEALHIGAVGVRQHLALLERDGLVTLAGLRRNVGRPSHLYALTAHAESYFPKSYDTIALDVIDHLAELGGEEAVTEAFRRRRERLASRYAVHVRGKPRVQQIAALTEILIEQGYMCEYEQLEDGSFVLTEHNCPVDCVARQHPQLCGQEIALYEDLLGVSLVRDTTIAKGDLCCSYRIPG
jgi:predicted ArsR family transcriptional regulator